jgi:hypothetical protein
MSLRRWSPICQAIEMHTEAQMIGALKQLEAGRKAEDVAREVGVSKQRIYAWKAKYGGMDLPCDPRGGATLRQNPTSKDRCLSLVHCAQECRNCCRCRIGSAFRRIRLEQHSPSPSACRRICQNASYKTVICAWVGAAGGSGEIRCAKHNKQERCRIRDQARVAVHCFLLTCTKVPLKPSDLV